MDDDDDNTIRWEDGEDDDDEEIDWEENAGLGSPSRNAFNSGENGLGRDGEDKAEEEGDHDEPEERRWLGDNGEIVVELPREDGDDVGNEDDDGGGDSDGNGEGKKGKGKAKPHRFTAEEIQKALTTHKVHLVCLVARCSLVSRWIGDPAVQAAMVSCLPTDLIPRKLAPSTEDSHGGGGAGTGLKEEKRSALAVLVVWFRGFFTVLDDDAVGGGGDGLWGSRPPRLLRVIDQRAGCAHEAVQLFVALCRGLGLRARYVACLDPLPPFPRLRRPSRQTRNNTVDLAAATGGTQARNRRGSGGRRVARMRSRAWAEVLCQDGKDLHVVTEYSRSVQQMPWSTSHPPKRQQTSKFAFDTLGGSSATPLALSDDDDGGDASNGDCSSKDGFERSNQDAGDIRTPVEGGKRESTAGVRAGRKRKAEVEGDGDENEAESTRAKRRTARAAVVNRGRKEKGEGVDLNPAKMRRAEERHAPTLPTRPVGGNSIPTTETTGSSRRRRRQNHKTAKSAAETGGVSCEPMDVELSGRDGATLNSGATRPGAREKASTGSLGGDGIAVNYAVAPDGGRERWVHVDPVEGAVDQAEKVQSMRFRKQLMPYVVAEDEKRVIVDVTRRYTSEWSRTLRARGRAMASPDGWWNQALRQWGASSDGGNRLKAGTGRAEHPVTVEGESADASDRDHRASEEKELEEKVNNEPVPSTVAALKNHHVYVLGKNLLKFEGLRPGAKAAGLVKGSKVFLKSDVSRLKGASRWKMDGLKVKDEELDKPAKVATKKGEKDGEGTTKLYGEWQTKPWVPEAAVNGKVPKNEYGNVEFFDCSPALLPPGTKHMQGDQIGRVAAKLGVDYAPALTGFETKQGRQVPVLDGIIVCKEQSQMLQDAHTAWEQTVIERRVKAREQRVLRRWSTLFRGLLLGAKLLEEYGAHD